MNDINFTFPNITRFTSDSILYDRIGDENVEHICITYDDNKVYFLIDRTGVCVEFDIQTRDFNYVNPIIVNTSYVNSIIRYDNKLYAFAGYQATKFIDNTVFYVLDNNKLIQESVDGTVKYTHIQSDTEIRDFFVDEEYNYYIIHNTNKISKFTKDRIPVYSIEIKNTATNYFYDIGVSTNSTIELIKMDYVREYTPNGLSSYPIILGCDGNTKELFLMKLNDKLLSESVSDNYLIDVPVFLKDSEGNKLVGEHFSYDNPNRINYNLTNYEYLKNKYSNHNEMLFRITLKNEFNNEDYYNISIPISTELFTTEKHHFTFRLDSINGIITIFLDGKIIATEYIKPGQYLFQNVFYEGMSIGNTYYSNKTTLDRYLNQLGYYYCDNFSVDEFKMYNKALTDNEINFSILNNIDVDDLIVSIPSGQRNALDVIERQFKLDITGNKSNKFNIIVKNSGIVNPLLQQQMSQILKEKLVKYIPATSEIYNIEFRN
jgi:hypothetical protein